MGIKTQMVIISILLLGGLFFFTENVFSEITVIDVLLFMVYALFSLVIVILCAGFLFIIVQPAFMVAKDYKEQFHPDTKRGTHLFVIAFSLWHTLIFGVALCLFRFIGKWEWTLSFGGAMTFLFLYQISFQTLLYYHSKKKKTKGMVE